MRYTRHALAWLSVSLALLSACQPMTLVTETPVPTEAGLPTATSTAETVAPTASAFPEATPEATETPAATATPTALPTPEEYVVFSQCAQEYCNDLYISFADVHGKVLKQLGIFQPRPDQIQQYVIFDTVPSPDSRSLATKVFWPVEGGLVGGQYWVDLSRNISATVLPLNDGPVAWAPDSQRFAFASEDGRLYVWNVTTQQSQELTDGQGIGAPPAWSPDGRYLAFACQLTRTSPEHRWANANLCLIQPDGSGLRVVANDVFLQSVFEFEGGRQALDWSPDSQRLVYVSGADQPDIAIVDIETGETHIVAASLGKDVNPDWSPDGSRIAFVSNRNGKDEIFVVDADGKNLVSLTPNAQADSYSPIWSPSGQRLAFLTRIRTFDVAQDNLHIINADGSELVTVGPYLMEFQRRPAWITSLTQ
jgi:WD40 repeat protein